MKINLLKTILTSGLIILTSKAVNSQNNEKLTKLYIPETIEVPKDNSSKMATCTDRNLYSGTSASYVIKLGGKLNATKIYRLAQVFPSYSGQVSSVAFTARKFGTSPNYNAQVTIWNLSGGVPVSPISNTLTAVVSSSALTTYTVNFTNPINVTSGFAVCVGFNNSNLDSFYVAASNTLSTSQYLGYLQDVNSGFSWNDNESTFGVDFNFLMFPAYSVTNPGGNNIGITRTTNSCVVPANYNFVNNSTSLPSYVNNYVINPQGTTRVLDFGDATPTFTNFTTTHTYVTSGNYNITANQTYIGWSTNCPETHNYSVSVGAGNTTSAFNLNGNGYTVNFTNNSTNGVSYLWNFGDLSTSTQQNPPAKTYGSAGTYVVELDVTAPNGCTIKSSQSISVPGNIGIRELTSLNDYIGLFPNPSSKQITLSSTLSDLEGYVLIYSSTGSLIKTFTNVDFDNNKASFNIEDLQGGVYFVKAKTKSGIAVKSFVKQ